MAEENASEGGTKKTRLDPVDHLRSLPVIRERCAIIYEVGEDVWMCLLLHL